MEWTSRDLRGKSCASGSGEPLGARPSLQIIVLRHSDAFFGIPSLWEALWCHQNASISLPSRNLRGTLHYRWSGNRDFLLYPVYEHILHFRKMLYFVDGGTLRPDIDLRDSCVCCFLVRVMTFPSSASPVLASLYSSVPQFST